MKKYNLVTGFWATMIVANIYNSSNDFILAII